MSSSPPFVPTQDSLSRWLQADREHRLQLGLTDERNRAYTDELWRGASREDALATAVLGLDLDEESRAYISESLENLPGPEDM